MKAKSKLYRVELFNDNAPLTGQLSAFDKHPTLDSATQWAIEKGKLGNAAYVRLYRKLEHVYNHYEFVTQISLTND